LRICHMSLLFWLRINTPSWIIWVSRLPLFAFITSKWKVILRLKLIFNTADTFSIFLLKWLRTFNALQIILGVIYFVSILARTLTIDSLLIIRAFDTLLLIIWMIDFIIWFANTLSILYLLFRRTLQAYFMILRIMNLVKFIAITLIIISSFLAARTLDTLAILIQNLIFFFADTFSTLFCLFWRTFNAFGIILGVINLIIILAHTFAIYSLLITRAFFAFTIFIKYFIIVFTNTFFTIFLLTSRAYYTPWIIQGVIKFIRILAQTLTIHSLLVFRAFDTLSCSVQNLIIFFANTFISIFLLTWRTWCTSSHRTFNFHLSIWAIYQLSQSTFVTFILFRFISFLVLLIKFLVVNYLWTWFY